MVEEPRKWGEGPCFLDVGLEMATVTSGIGGKGLHSWRGLLIWWVLLLMQVGVAVLVLTSTGFLERGRPLCIWRSQYLWLGATSLEHLHFLPSVLLHLPGSGSVPLANLRLKPPSTENKNEIKKQKGMQSSRNSESKPPCDEKGHSDLNNKKR